MVRVIIHRRLQWAEYVSGMGTGKTEQILVEETSWEYPIGRPRKRSENSKLKGREMVCNEMWNWLRTETRGGRC
jgi:hypothetical protein